MVCFHAEKMPHTVSALTSPVHSTASVASLLLLCLSRTASLPGLRPLPGRYFPDSCTAPPSLHSGVCFVATLTGLSFTKSHSHRHSLFLQPNLFFLNVTPPDVSLLVHLISSHLIYLLLPAYPLEGEIHGVRDFILHLTTSPVPGVDSGM